MYTKVVGLRRLANRLMRAGKTVVGQLVFTTGVHRLLLGNSAAIIGFHRVNNRTLGDGWTCSIEMFKSYCEFFSKHFQVVSLRHLIKKLETGAALCGELVITFDDGYVDNYEHAAPVLKALGLPATFFVVSHFVGKECGHWWGKDKVRLHGMSWDQVRWLSREGFEIGSHTRTHVNLGKVAGDEAWEEIHGSRLDLEDQLSTEVDLFAYPYGGKHHLTDQNREMIKAAGFGCCCSGFGGFNSTDTSPFHLKRIGAPSYQSPYHFGFDLLLRLI